MFVLFRSTFIPYLNKKTIFFFFSWILFFVLVAVNVMRLAADHLMARLRARPQEEVNNIPEEPVAPRYKFC